MEQFRLLFVQNYVRPRPPPPIVASARYRACLPRSILKPPVRDTFFSRRSTYFVLFTLARKNAGILRKGFHLLPRCPLFRVSRKPTTYSLHEMSCIKDGVELFAPLLALSSGFFPTLLCEHFSLYITASRRYFPRRDCTLFPFSSSRLPSYLIISYPSYRITENRNIRFVHRTFFFLRFLLFDGISQGSMVRSFHLSSLHPHRFL